MTCHFMRGYLVSWCRETSTRRRSADGTERSHGAHDGGSRLGGSGVPQLGSDRARDDPVRDRRDAVAHDHRDATRDRDAPGRGRLVDDAEGATVIGVDARADAAEVLRRCQMPEDEIRWVLTAHDPAVVHMILELHRERLEEELAERRKALGELEASLISLSCSRRASR